MSIYILSATQISSQQPLSDEWLQSPIRYQQSRVASLDPDFHRYVASKDYRRIGKLIKRALATVHCTLNAIDNPMPNAIVTGTGLGCIDNTEKFLHSIIENDESLLAPTHFIYSTHNTIGSQIALNLKCHGYNNTYSQQGSAFDSALYDVYTQFQLNRIGSALVGCYDEMTDNYFQLLNQISYFGTTDASQLPYVSEVAMSMFLSSQPSPKPWCKLDAMSMLYRPSLQRLHDELHRQLSDNDLSLSDIDTVVVGTNGIPSIDAIYHNFLSLLHPSIRIIDYKRLFGENPSISGIGLYVAAALIHHQQVPSHMMGSGHSSEAPRHILVYNQFQNRHHSLILLSAC